MKRNSTERLAPSACIVLYPVVEFVKNFTTGYNYSAIKLFWLKHKRVILIVDAVIFLVVIFLTKNDTVFKNTDSSLQQVDGLVYQNSEIGDLVARDTDGDEIFDWEEGLWGTDPTKKDTDDDGISDDKEIAQLKAEAVGGVEPSTSENIKLTKTEKFSQEFLTTIAALGQEGAIDETTVEQISTALAENIQDSVQVKIYTLSDLKITEDNSVQGMKNYYDLLSTIYTKNYTVLQVINVLEKLNADEDNTMILLQLKPIIESNRKIINEIVNVQVPRTISFLHLDLLNISQAMLENIIGMQSLETDPIVAMSAINQYEQNLADLEFTSSQLTEMIRQKLNN